MKGRSSSRDRLVTPAPPPLQSTCSWGSWWCTSCCAPSTRWPTCTASPASWSCRTVKNPRGTWGPSWGTARRTPAPHRPDPCTTERPPSSPWSPRPSLPITPSARAELGGWRPPPPPHPLPPSGGSREQIRGVSRMTTRTVQAAILVLFPHYVMNDHHVLFVAMLRLELLVKKDQDGGLELHVTWLKPSSTEAWLGQTSKLEKLPSLSEGICWRSQGFIFIFHS